jgi:hypothetical protein
MEDASPTKRESFLWAVLAGFMIGLAIFEPNHIQSFLLTFGGFAAIILSLGTFAATLEWDEDFDA